MNRKRRNAVRLTTHSTRYQMSEWCKHNKNVPFNVPFLCEQIGMNPMNVFDRSKVYNGIVYWRKKFIEKYYAWKKAGKFVDKDRYQAWDIMLFNYNQNDAYVFLSKYDKKSKTHYFIQPSFFELETMDRKRLEKQWRGIGTIIKEMITYDARLVLLNGERKPIEELLAAGTNFDNLLLRGKSDEQ